MFAKLIPCLQARGENIDHCCRRRRRNARNICKKTSFWSALWCRRMIAWKEHVDRGQKYQHICFHLLNYKNSDWLVQQRSPYVPVDGSEQTRNTIFVGRTGTRANIGRPQVRWADGLIFAEEIITGRSMSQDGSNALSIGTAMREAMIAARNFVEQFNSQSSLSL